MDRIFLRELRIDAVIGIWEWERRIRQTVSLDLEMATDARRAARADAAEETLNYKDVAKRLIEFVGESKFQLVESLAEAVAGIIIREFNVPWVKVSVSKPAAIEGSKEVGIVIERSADDYG
jgi:7,8-dihydroneopterin aldolase/epimerase/oxygenase